MVQKSKDARSAVQTHRNILKEFKFEIEPETHNILDFGCGSGSEVYQFRKMGYKAYGCDIENRFDNIQNLCQEEQIISHDESIFRPIDISNYRIPFDDESFDFVCSNQVFEHVQDYQQALSEIHRVLKSGGYSLHYFPSRYRPIECHTYVPLAGVFRGYFYLAFWAFLGIRNSFQKGRGFKETARDNFEYLNNQTKYLTKAEIRKLVSNQFNNVSFIEGYFMKHGEGRLRKIYRLTKKLTFISSLIISTFHTRVILFRKPHQATPSKIVSLSASKFPNRYLRQDNA